MLALNKTQFGTEHLITTPGNAVLCFKTNVSLVTLKDMPEDKVANETPIPLLAYPIMLNSGSVRVKVTVCLYWLYS